MTLPIVERLRGYYTMDAGKPMFDSSKRVHRAADLHEAANAIEGIVDELIAAEQALVRAQRKFIEFDKPDQHQECMNAAYHIRQVLAKLGGDS
jgi:hypothetical protein